MSTIFLRAVSKINFRVILEDGWKKKKKTRYETREFFSKPASHASKEKALKVCIQGK